ncbi:MAG: histidine kinase [Clostridia bacterium]|nr:histidine kinase [Clostridia bacterium]
MKIKLFKSVFLTRMVIYYSLLLILFVSAFVVVLYRVAEDRQQNVTMLAQQELTAKTASQLDNYIKDMDDIAQRVMADTNVVVFFKNLSQDPDPSNYFAQNIMQAIDVSSILKTINGPAEPMWRISVYNQNGDYIYTGASTSNYGFIQNRLSRTNVAEQMINMAYSGECIVVSPTDDRWSDYYSSKYISVLRPVMNPYSKNAYAVVEVQQDVSKLENILQLQTTGDIQLRIYNKNNELIFPRENVELISGENVYKTSAISEMSGWTVELARTKQQKYTDIFILFFFIYLGLILLIIVITYIIAQKVTRPLQELRKSVSSVSAHNTAIKIDEDGGMDEIKELGDAFSNVLHRMTEAAEHEKKAYSLALQAQMNPHFLFNTLSVISAVGMEAGSDKIVNICQMVSDMLRYVASYESGFVPLGDEIAHTKNYLELMKARYEEYFLYDIFIDEKVNSILVPKLILQPLVENCFRHAFSNTEPPWIVHIRVWMENDWWHIEVKDNGVGIPDAQIQAINEKIKEYSENITEGYKELKIGGLGLISTITRLKLMMGVNIVYKIKAEENGGTLIRIDGETV